MRWFGISWGAVVCTAETHADTPVGEPCLSCERAIEWDDQGLLVPSYTDTVSERPWHKECLLESLGIGRKEEE